MGDARRVLELMPPREQAACKADPARLVDAWVANELLAQEALRRGLDKNREFRLRFTRATHSILIAEMRRRVLDRLKVEISDDELRRIAGEEAGGELPNEFIVLCAIVNTDRAKVEQALAELDAGKPFAEVHAACSSEKDPAFGTYSDATIETAPEAVRTAIADLKDGERTGVIEIDGRFAVIEVTRRPAVIDLDALRDQLLSRRQDELFLKWVKDKRVQHNVSVNKARLEKVKLPGSEAGSPPPTPAGQ
ncbi:MAG TPA: peptidylprolyl isomerase [Vicinamibacterales bacterium]|nr:peptidylprolyl isomerase [Vicinamibacterales bacterium]